MMMTSMVEPQWQDRGKKRDHMAKGSAVSKGKKDQENHEKIRDGPLFPGDPNLATFTDTEPALRKAIPLIPKCPSEPQKAPTQPSRLTSKSATEAPEAPKSLIPLSSKAATEVSEDPEDATLGEVLTNPDKVPPTHHTTPIRNQIAEGESIVATTDSVIEDYYSFSEPVPGSKKKKLVYPRAPVLSDGWSVSDYQDRFEVVKDQLQRTVNEDVKLRDKIKTPILYRLRMVGTVPTDAVPSVVIIWDDSRHMKALQSLFSSRAQYSLNCGAKRTWSDPFGENRPKHIPPLKLVYVLHARGAIIRMATLGVSLQAFRASYPLALCGKLPTNLRAMSCCGGVIEHEGASATLAVSIQIDKDSAYLTVNHIFPPQVVIDSKTPSCREPLPSITSERMSDNKTQESCHLWENDDDEYEYEDQDENDRDSSNAEETEMDSPATSKGIHDRCEGEDWELVSLPLGLDSAFPYLDWSLARPVSSFMDTSQSNLFFLDDSDPSPTVVDKIRSKPREHLAMIKMVSGIRGPLVGRILADSSFLATLPGQNDCEVFTVILDTPGGLIPGECGSIVIDQETAEAYGHVIGCDPSGHALVVPLEHVLSQVKACFLASHVGLGGPFEGELPTLRSTMDGLADQRGDTHMYDEDEEPNQIAGRIATMSVMARVFHQEGKYKIAAKKYLDILELQKKALRKHHPDALTSLENIGFELDCAEKFDEALRIYKEVYQLKRQVLGENHPDTVPSLNSIAFVLESQLKYNEAERIGRRAFALRERVLGSDHPDTLKSMKNLAFWLESQEKFDEAEIITRKLLSLQQGTLGGDHLDTLTSRNNLALLLNQLGKYTEAESMDRRTLALRKVKLGPEHPSTLTSMGNLAGSLENQEKYDESEVICRQVLALRERILGHKHPHTLISRSNLAIVLEKQGKFHEAEAMSRYTLAAREAALGVEHPDTLNSMEDLAQLLKSMGQHHEAEHILKCKDERQEKASNIGHTNPSTYRDQVVAPNVPSGPSRMWSPPGLSDQFPTETPRTRTEAAREASREGFSGNPAPGGIRIVDRNSTTISLLTAL